MNIIQCKICKRLCKGNTGFGIHLRKLHKTSRERYYKKFGQERFCLFCGNVLTIIQTKFCSQSCSAKEHNKMALDACRGDKHWLRNLDNPKYAKSEETRRKKISISFRKFSKNGTHPSFREEVKKKIKETMIKGMKKGTYGQKSIGFSIKASEREKRKSGIGIHVFQTKKEEITEKRKATLLKRYGVDNPLKVKTFADKIRGKNHPYWRGGISKSYGNDWNEVRDFILERDENKCIICGTTKRIHVHHLIPIKTTPEPVNDPFYLISLCQKHHLEEEWTKKHEKKIVEYLNNWGESISKGGIYGTNRT